MGCWADPRTAIDPRTATANRDMAFDPVTGQNGPHVDPFRKHMGTPYELSFFADEFTTRVDFKNSCGNLCSDRGFQYMGLQFSSDCWCANHYGDHGLASNCGSGDGEACGDGRVGTCDNANAVFATAAWGRLATISTPAPPPLSGESSGTSANGLVTAVASSPRGWTTYLLQIVLPTTVANVYSLSGTSETRLTMPAAYQVPSPFGVDIGGGNPAFFDSMPESEFDSWVTVGPTDGSAVGAISSIGIDFASWTADAGLSVDNGAVFWMDPSSGPGGADPICLAQITVPEGSTFTAGGVVQGRLHTADTTDTTDTVDTVDTVTWGVCASSYESKGTDCMACPGGKYDHDGNGFTLCEACPAGRYEGRTGCSSDQSLYSYSYNPNPLTWLEAEAACVQNGGHLAGIHTEADEERVLAAAGYNGTQGFWIGLTHDHHETRQFYLHLNFVWADGAPTQSDMYLNWATEAGAPQLATQVDYVAVGADCVAVGCSGWDPERFTKLHAHFGEWLDPDTTYDLNYHQVIPRIPSVCAVAMDPPCSALCAAGRYGSGGDSSSLCTGPCAAGRFGSEGSATNQCTGPCAAGQYGDEGSTTSQCTSSCPAGRFSEGGTGGTGPTANDCQDCPAGQTSVNPTSAENCFDCRPGQFAAVAGSYCSLCPRGRFTADMGATSCRDCRTGMWTLDDGASASSECAVPTFCSDSAASNYGLDGTIEDCSYECSALAQQSEECIGDECCLISDPDTDRWPVGTISGDAGGQASANAWLTVADGSHTIIQGKNHPDTRQLSASASNGNTTCSAEELVLEWTGGSCASSLNLVGADAWTGLVHTAVVIADPLDGCMGSRENGRPAADLTGTFVDGSMVGKVALIRSGDCDATSKAINAQHAGAVAVAIYWDSADREAEMVSYRAAGIMIPTVLLSEADGNALRAVAVANPATVVDIRCQQPPPVYSSMLAICTCRDDSTTTTRPPAIDTRHSIFEVYTPSYGFEFDSN